MWADKRYQEQPQQNGSSNFHKNNPVMTPRSKGKPNIPMPNSRRSVTPSRVQERVSASPLRVPLERAIEKCTRQKSLERPSSRSRMTNRSSRQGDSSVVYRRGAYEEEDSCQSNRKYHTETVAFLKKYFDFQYPIPQEQFVDRIIQDYGQIWSDHNTDQFLDHFSWKIIQNFGEEIAPRQLLHRTQNNGMIGLILQICQSIQESKQVQSNARSTYTAFSKSPNIMSINKSFDQQVSECVNVQHLKNCLQQFMETMYHEMQKQIYDKFNAQMKRMVLKHREADKMLKKISDKLINHADFFDAQKKWSNKVRILEEENRGLSKQLEKKEEENRKQKQISYQLKSGKSRLQDQVKKLKESNEKYQNLLFNKFQNLPSNENSSVLSHSPISLSRKMPSNGPPLADRTQDYSNQNGGFNSEPKPFQIKIDTQFIHREAGPPMTQTTTTFVDKNSNGGDAPMGYPLSESNLTSRCYSPIKISSQALDSGRPSFEAGIRPGTRIGQYTYSPYQGKSSRLI